MVKKKLLLLLIKFTLYSDWYVKVLGCILVASRSATKRCGYNYCFLELNAAKSETFAERGYYKSFVSALKALLL